jgi:alkylation response protein AidB-like acyl-CoA dehydrogenase
LKGENMDFNLSDEQQQLIKSLKIFTEKEIELKAAEIDHKGMIPDSLIKKMSQMGLLGMTIPKEYGGPGLWFLGAGLPTQLETCIGTYSGYGVPV